VTVISGYTFFNRNLFSKVGDSMKLKQWMSVIVIGASVLSLAACSTGKKKNAWAVNDSNAAYTNDDAQSSGTGDDTRLTENDTDSANSGGANLLAKRTYHFDFDSDAVRSDDRPAIEANASHVASSGNTKVMLEGHTDPRGSREYNIGLGERRAKSVAEVMTTKGANAKQIRIVSYGAEKPAAQGASESAYQQDRRVALVYQNQNG
jgi:peptidoglycan-associated lipoprotein